MGGRETGLASESGRGRVAAADSGRGMRARRQAGKERESGSAREVDRARGPRSGLRSVCSRGETGERARVAGRPKGEGAAVWAEVLVAGPNGRRKEAAGWAVAG